MAKATIEDLTKKEDFFGRTKRGTTCPKCGIKTIYIKFKGDTKDCAKCSNGEKND